MNIRKPFYSCLVLTLCVISPGIVRGLTLSGSINASTVTVNGDVAINTATVSTLTVTELLNVEGTTSGIDGLVLQSIFCSTTTQFDTTSSTPIAIPGLSATLALSNTNNYVRITLSGGLGVEAVEYYLSYLSITRDSQIIGSRLATDRVYPGVSSVGITVIDFPRDTSSHTYSAKLSIAPEYDGETASFPVSSLGSFLVQEISQ